MESVSVRGSSQWPVIKVWFFQEIMGSSKRRITSRRWQKMLPDAKRWENSLRGYVFTGLVGYASQGIWPLVRFSVREMTHSDLEFRKTFLTAVCMVWRETGCILIVAHTKGLHGLTQSNIFICSVDLGESLGVRIRGGRTPGFQPGVIGWIVVPFSKIAQKRRENLGVQMSFWFRGASMGCPGGISTG